jgi:hypothetical protein
MGWYLTGQCIWYIILVSQRGGLSLSQALNGVGPAVSLALACYGFLGSFYPFTLVSYHFYLNFSGQNTHEYVRLWEFWIWLTGVASEQGPSVTGSTETVQQRECIQKSIGGVVLAEAYNVCTCLERG